MNPVWDHCVQGSIDIFSTLGSMHPEPRKGSRFTLLTEGVRDPGGTLVGVHQGRVPGRKDPGMSTVSVSQKLRGHCFYALDFRVDVLTHCHKQYIEGKTLS